MRRRARRISSNFSFYQKGGTGHALPGFYSEYHHHVSGAAVPVPLFQNAVFQLGAAAGSGTWQRLTAPVSDQISDAPSSDTLSAPVRAAVTGEYGRYGSISLTTDSESFTPIKTLLREVLGSARSRMDSSAAAFRSALGKPSVYCDFLESLPVSYLADLMGITAESELSVRALAAAEQNGQVVLLLWDGGSRYYQCVTAVQPSTLTEVLDHFELGVTAFAFEDLSGYGQHLAPLSLFPDPLPELPQLTVTESTVSTETLLSVLGFNPTPIPAIPTPAARR